MEERFGGWREREKERERERRKNEKESRGKAANASFLRNGSIKDRYVRLYDDSASTRIRKSEKGFEIKKIKGRERRKK